MKIHNIKINSYGNLKDKEINLNKKINLIYGKNESGKSTFFNFIVNMLYGASKNKKGKEISDFDKYKPWNSEEFSGRMEYSLDNGKTYNIFREFKKKSPIIYNENGEDITSKYILDKNNGNQFFYEQTNIDEELFLSSTAVMQQQVEMDVQSKNTAIQKLSNMAGSGNDNISYKKCIDTLNKKQLTEIGTERSQDRPINKINKKLEELKEEKKELLSFQNKKYEIEQEIEKTIAEINKQEEKINNLNELAKVKQNIDKEEEKIRINTQINESNKLEIKEIELRKEKEEKELSEIRENSKVVIDNKKYILLTSILLILNVLIILTIKNNLKYLVLISLLIVPVIYLINLNSLKNRVKTENKQKIGEKKLEINKIESQLEILYKNKDNVEQEINTIKSKINLIKENREEINLSIINLEKENQILNDLKLKLHMIELDKNNIFPKLDTLANIEEQIELLEEEKNNLESKNISIELAKETLQQAYKIMKENITPKFAENLSTIISKISNGKYNKIKITEENDIVVEIDNGKYIPINLLSTGTIDQAYLALRISIIKEISGEALPIILDESFAYYDDQRLEKILDYISNNIDNQIIILTCTNREKNILDKLNIDYNHIKFSNDL